MLLLLFKVFKWNHLWELVSAFVMNNNNNNNISLIPLEPVLYTCPGVTTWFITLSPLEPLLFFFFLLSSTAAAVMLWLFVAEGKSSPIYIRLNGQMSSSPLMIAISRTRERERERGDTGIHKDKSRVPWPCASSSATAGINHAAAHHTP